MTAPVGQEHHLWRSKLKKILGWIIVYVSPALLNTEFVPAGQTTAHAGIFPSLLPEWSGACALMGCIVWPFIPAIRFLSSRTMDSVPPARRIKLYLAWALPPSLLAWLMWGDVDILALYLLCGTLNLSFLLPKLSECHTGILIIDGSQPRQTPPTPKPFNGAHALKFAFVWLLSLISCLCFFMSFLAAYVFALRNAYISGDEQHTGLWIGGILVTAVLAWSVWSTMAANFSAASPAKRLAMFCPLALPVLGAAGYAVVFWMPRDITPSLVGGLAGWAIVMLIRHAVKIPGSHHGEGAPPKNELNEVKRHG